MKLLVASCLAAGSVLGCGDRPESAAGCGAGPVGRLQGTGYEVVLHGGAGEPRYTVRDGEGAVVLECVSRAHLEAQQPDVYQKLRPLLTTLESPNFGYMPDDPSGLSAEGRERLRVLGYE